MAGVEGRWTGIHSAFSFYLKGPKMVIDRTSLPKMRDELEALLKGWAEKNKVSLEIGGASFMPDQNVTFKLKIANTVTSEKGVVVMSQEAIDFMSIAPSHGFAPGDINRTFPFKGRKYTITGWLARSWKAPILASRDDGKKFKFPVDAIKRALGIGGQHAPIGE